MKIAHILRKYNPSEWGGTESVLQQMTDGLAQHGVQSTVYCPTLSEQVGGEPSPGDPLREAGCIIKRFHATFPVWGLTEEARRQALSVGGNLLSFELPRMLSREANVDVVHAHVLGRLGGIARSVARRRHVPFVVTIHGGALDLSDTVKQELATYAGKGLEWGKVFGLRWGAHRVLSDAEAILTCNPREAELLRQQHPNKRIIAHPHGVKYSRFQTDHRAAACQAFPEITGRMPVVCLGRIDVVKNQSWLVEQLPALLERYPKLLLVFAGACTNHAYGESLRKLIRGNGLEQAVLLTGGLPPGDPRLIGLMQQAHAMILPSISETFGLVIVEAWAAGTPVLASRTSGSESLIRPGEDGYLFDLAHPQTFHDALTQLFADPRKRTQMVTTAKARAENEFDTVRLAGRICELYEQLIAQKHTLRGVAG